MLELSTRIVWTDDGKVILPADNISDGEQRDDGFDGEYVAWLHDVDESRLIFH